jgi:hypothetical protein
MCLQFVFHLLDSVTKNPPIAFPKLQDHEPCEYRGRYPSLRRTLQPEHIPALNEAILAFSLGNFDESHAIFEQRLPPSHTLPILALERSRAYVNQGLCSKRAELLRKALESQKEDIGRERWLMHIMRCWDESSLYGTLKTALMETRKLRDVLPVNLPLQEYSEIDVRTISVTLLVSYTNQSHFGGVYCFCISPSNVQDSLLLKLGRRDFGWPVPVRVRTRTMEGSNPSPKNVAEPGKTLRGISLSYGGEAFRPGVQSG